MNNNNDNESDTTGPQRFCLSCNASLELPPTQSQELALVLVNPGTEDESRTEESDVTNTNLLALQDGQGGITIPARDDSNAVAIIQPPGTPVTPERTEDEINELEWMVKYQTFLSKTLHINFELFSDPDEPSSKRFKTGGDGISPKVIGRETAMFCIKCKKEIERLYFMNEQAQLTMKEFETTRDRIASAIARAYVEQKLKGDELPEESDFEEVVTATSESLLGKWKHIYTGQADKELKEKNLINEVKEEVSARNEIRSKTEFPEGTGLSAMELAKMQRMMTACYFTPKMSIVRKKGKLFFRVGIPREDTGMLYKCSSCEDDFVHQRSLNIHMRKHRIQNAARHLIHTCPTCGEVFTDRRELIFHKKNLHGGSSEGPRAKYKRFQEYYGCSFCTSKFSSKAGRNSHIKKSHPTEKLYPCVSCQEIFASDTRAKQHMETVHSHSQTSITVVSNSVDNSLCAEVYTCSDCSKPFLKVKSLSEHMKVHLDPTINGCFYCGMGFSSLEALQTHTATVHVDPNPYNCEGCDERFFSDLLLLSHMKSHRIKTYICETCGKVSRSKEAFRKHFLTHAAPAKTYTCDICNVCFLDQKVYETHMVKHAGKLPYKCNVCGDEEGFKDAKDLRKHKIEAHPESMQDLPHSCTLCWNSFSTPEGLQEHNEKTHEKYKCHICSRVFKLGDHLRRHLFIHTGEKPYQCSICEKSFNQESNLKEHVYRHSGVRPHRCPYCPRIAYLRRVQLKEHMQREHGVEDVPTLPMGRAAQNARKAGIFPIPLSGDTVAGGGLDESKVIELSNLPMLSLAQSISLQPQPMIVNDVTIGDDGVHERIAPLIMKSLQNKSNQPIIVRRGLQVPEKSSSQYQGVIQLKSEGMTADGQIIDATKIDTTQPQQFMFYQI